MKAIYVLGSLNIDLVFEATQIPKKGETLQASNFFINEGGKGANQAVAASKQNCKTYLIGSVGNDVFANQLISKIKEYNVDDKYIKIKNSSSGVAGILLNDSDNRILINGGANLLIENEDIDEALNNITNNDIFICQLENNIDATYYALNKAKAKQATIIFNPAPAKNIKLDVLENIDFLILNEIEALTITNANNIDEAINILISLNVKNIIITLGENGCLYLNKNIKRKYEACKIKAIDTTGAGDTFIGCFASMYLKTNNIDESIVFAIKGSALACLKKGAQVAIPTYKEIVNAKF